MGRLYCTQNAAMLFGVDFTCAPSRRKPITVARGRLQGDTVQVQRVDALASLADFDALLREPGPWFGGFDFPFGLPRAFVDAQALGPDSDTVIGELRRRWPDRVAWRAAIDAWVNSRPPGQRLPHRRTDTALPGTRSTSPLQTRYVPVGFMYFEGMARLAQAGVTIPRQRAGDPSRVAVEAYPGLAAFELIGRRPYKNRDTPDRRDARHDLVAALEVGRPRLGLRVQLDTGIRERLVDDTGGDRLDAVLCLLQAAWASRLPDAGQPADVDPVEGWIATAPASA
jgi:hypothetical protein